MLTIDPICRSGVKDESTEDTHMSASLRPQIYQRKAACNNRTSPPHTPEKLFITDLFQSHYAYLLGKENMEFIPTQSRLSTCWKME